MPKATVTPNCRARLTSEVEASLAHADGFRVNDVLLTASVSNVGTGSTDADSIFAVLTMDQANAFLNAVTPSFGGIVGFASGSPALTFNPATDLRFSNSATRPSGFAQCSYTPVAGYDPQVRHVCLNPKGSLPNGTTTGQFTVQLRARIN